MERPWQLYILRCGDGTLYTGIALDAKKRFLMHQKGKGAKYTRGRGPLTLLYTETCAGHSDALKRELEVKAMTREEKEALIARGNREGRVFLGDAEKCFTGVPDPERNRALAMEYWKQPQEEAPAGVCEILADGEITVLEIV